MASFLRLTAVLTAFLPASALVSTLAGGDVQRLLRRAPISATVSGSPGDQLREALITSEAFEDLVKRLEERSHHEDADVGGFAVVGGRPNRAASAPTHGPHEHTAFTAAAFSNRPKEDAGSSDHTKQPNAVWKRNSEKLAAVRTAVLESPRISGMRKALKTTNGSASAHHTPAATTASLPEKTAGSASPTGAAAAASAATLHPEQQRSVEQQHVVGSSSTPAAVAAAVDEKESLVATEPGGLEGERDGRGARRFRWLARVGRSVSNVGRRVRGRVARVVTKDSMRRVKEHNSR